MRVLVVEDHDGERGKREKIVVEVKRGGEADFLSTMNLILFSHKP